MTTDKTPATLATVKHGGCVQLPTSERERFEAWARLNGYTLTRAADGEYCFISVRNLWTSWQEAAPAAQPQYITDAYELGMRDGQNLSAQPSPGGQDACAQFSQWWSQQSDDIANLYAYEIARLGWDGALAARQPVVEITDAEIDTRLNALYREMVDSGQHNGGMSGVAWDRAVYRMASSQPAQAVGLAAFKALYHAYVRLLESGRDRIIDLGGTCDPVDVMEANDVDLQAAQRVMDSQAVGNG